MAAKSLLVQKRQTSYPPKKERVAIWSQSSTFMQRARQSMTRFSTLFSNRKSPHLGEYLGVTVWGGFYAVVCHIVSPDGGFARNEMHGLFIGDEVSPHGAMGCYCFVLALTHTQ